MREILKEMLNIPTTSGAEDKMRDYIAQKIKDSFDECETDSFGNLIMHKCGKGKHILLCAGLDDYGVIACYAHEGNIKLAPLGAISGKHIANRVCTFFNGTKAVITVEGNNSEPSVADCVAFAGQTDDNINPGDKAVFDTSITELCGGFISGFGISSRVGAAVILQWIMQQRIPSQYDLTVIFYAGSKKDDRGLAMAAAACIAKWGEFDFAAVVDAHEVTDGCKEGDGFALRLISKRYVCEAVAIEQIKAYFEQNNLKLQFLSDNSSDSSAQALANSYTGILCAELCVPVKNVGTFAECIKL